MKSSTSLLVTLLLAVLVTALSSAACVSDGFGRPRATRRLEVTFEPDAAGIEPNLGTPDGPRPLAVDIPQPFFIRVRALRLDGGIDTDFTRYVRIAAKPGAIEPLNGPDVDGRNVLLKNGESGPIQVNVENAYGVTYIVADDLGYVPADPLRQPPPQCSDGIDNDGDGTIDFPADEGCAFANDDAEEGGTYATGVSPPIYFELPRIAQVRGRKCEPSRGCSGTGSTPYPKEQIFLDTGYREPTTGGTLFKFSTVVTRISSDGFYVTDLDDAKDGFNSIFAFNFNAPPRMRVCDRLKNYGGTANEFFGFTQISYPTWTLEEWDPKLRLCLVPEPTLLFPGIIQDTSNLLRLSGSLVRAQTTPDRGTVLRITPNFGPGRMQCRVKGAVAPSDDPTLCDKDPVSGAYLFVPTPDATDCDLDKNGRITFNGAGDPENDCSGACTNDAECTEFSNYRARSTFRLTVQNSNGARAIQADATASAGFDPLALKGSELRSFSGTLHFFSGGSQFTIEARCKDDIIVDLQASPLRADLPCTATPECPAGFECLPLADGTQACRARVEGTNELTAPPQSCIFPRTFLENNPQ